MAMVWVKAVLVPGILLRSGMAMARQCNLSRNLGKWHGGGKATQP